MMNAKFNSTFVIPCSLFVILYSLFDIHLIDTLTRLVYYKVESIDEKT